MSAVIAASTRYMCAVKMRAAFDFIGKSRGKMRRDGSVSHPPSYQFSFPARMLIEGVGPRTAFPVQLFDFFGAFEYNFTSLGIDETSLVGVLAKHGGGDGHFG
jgi:hypothetical protein